MEERRSARVGTVSGLALLAGGTAVAAVAESTQSLFATGLLGLLGAGMWHALVIEIRRQARRGSPGGWAAQDTANAVLLACYAAIALIATVPSGIPGPVRAVFLGLSLGYAAACAYFVLERRRAAGTVRHDTAGVSAGVR
jgi:hypothetical protein